MKPLYVKPLGMSDKAADLMAKLRVTIHELETEFNPEDQSNQKYTDLLQQLKDAVDELEISLHRDKPMGRSISDKTKPRGYAMDQANKDIACDNVIAIVKQLKKLKG